MNRMISVRIVMLLLNTLGMRMGVFGGVSVFGELTHEHTLSPGESYNGQIVLYNSAEELKEAEVYQTDYFFNSSGQTFYQQPAGDLDRSNATWLEFSPKRISVFPNERAVVSFSVKVPNELSLRGTYWSVLMVQEAAPVDTADEVEGIRIQTVMRYANQIITHIDDDDAVRLLKFLNAQIIKEDEERSIQIDIENVGETLLRPNVWIELYNFEGEHMGKFESRPRRLFPGCSLRNNFEISQIPAGQYKVLVVADCGGDDLFGINYTIQIE